MRTVLSFCAFFGVAVAAGRNEDISKIFEGMNNFFVAIKINTSNVICN